VRVAYIADTREIGGAERHLATLAEEVAGRGHEVLLLAPQQNLVDWLAREAPGARALRAFDDRYQDAPSQIDRGAVLAALMPAFVRTLRHLSPDVVHSNNGGYPGSDLCRIAPLAARLAGARRRVMTVNSNPWPRERLADPRVQAAADRLVWSAVDAVAAPSEAVAHGLVCRRGLQPGKARLIPYGVRNARHDALSADKLRRRLAPGGELLVGMVSARPVAAKGYDVLVDALVDAGERVRGVLVGPPPDELVARAHAGNLRRLSLEGPRDNVGDYYAAFDVLVVPSIAEECMPLVILEAASVATPAFASRLAGIPEAFVDGVSGRLFAAGDAAALAALMRQADADRQSTTRMGHAARERWHRHFRVEQMVDTTLSLYAQPTAAARRWPHPLARPPRRRQARVGAR
jgi:glycosyltransferase involved in cell wall biosynthesis